MYHIEYAALNYYPSPVSDECLCLGILFHNITTGEKHFEHISNFRRFHTFDDEADVEFVKAYLNGIKQEIDSSIFNYNSEFELRDYIRFYANEFKFSKVKLLNVEENDQYIDDLTKIYLKYDMAKNQRLNINEEKRLIRRILETNNLKYTNKKIEGPYNDEIKFDYQLENLCIKIFSFKEKNLKRVIGNARQWSFVAEEMKPQKKVLFIYDIETQDKDNLMIILKILSKNAKVMKLDDGVDYILEQCIKIG